MVCPGGFAVFLYTSASIVTRNGGLKYVWLPNARKSPKEKREKRAFPTETAEEFRCDAHAEAYHYREPPADVDGAEK